jgi:hypothetical protein
MSELEKSRKSFLVNSRRNFRPVVLAGALLFAAAAPVWAAPAAAEKKVSQGGAAGFAFGHLLDEFLAVIRPGWAEARGVAAGLAGGGNDDGLQIVISNSEGDSEIEIEPRTPKIPPVPPPFSYGGPSR